MHKITIILPTYNRREFLPTALSCIQNQIFTNWKLLIINDGGENVSDIVNAFNEPRFEYHNRPHGGKAAALNYGLSRVESKYIGYMDDDDELYQDHFQLLYNAAEENNYELIYSDTRLTILDYEGKVIVDTVENEEDIDFEKIRFFNKINHKQILHSKALSDAVGVYDTSMSILIDYDYIRRLFKETEGYHVRKITGNHILRSKTHYPDSVNSITGLWKTDLDACSKSICSLFKKDSGSLANMYLDFYNKNNELQSLNKKLERINKINEEFDSKLQDINKEFEKELKQRAKKNNDTLQEYNKKIEDLKKELCAVYSSKSWKFTSPLRSFMYFLRLYVRSLINKTQQIMKKAIIALCLFPLSFYIYTFPKTWFGTLLRGKPFFANLKKHAYEMSQSNMSTMSVIGRFLVERPLQFAIKIMQLDSVLEALKSWPFNEKTVVRTLEWKKAQRIELIPGLYESTSEAIEQAKQYLQYFPQQSIAITEYAHCLYGAKENFTDSKVAIIAHWDPQSLIDPYVQYMAKHFKEQGRKVIIASADKPERINFSSCHKWVDAIVYRSCSGYDFTSWKAAFEVYPSLYDAEEVIWTNDSIFGPIGSILPMHESMDMIDCDFWGATESHERQPHLQSFYLVFRAKTLQSKAFSHFISYIPTSNAREHAVLCETSFAIWLLLHGLIGASFLTNQRSFTCNVNPSCEYWRELINLGFPYIKRELLSTNYRNVNLSGLIEILSGYGYPIELLLNYFLRMGIDISPLMINGERANNRSIDVLQFQQAVDLCEQVSCNQKHIIYSLGVFIHIYYEQLLPDICYQLKSIPKYSHIYISTDTAAKASLIRKNLEPLGFSILEVRICPNIGWDIAPFLIGFSDVLLKYDLILKIHAKCSSQIEKKISDDWRSLLFNSLIGNSEHVKKIISYFARHPELGMLCPPPVAHYAACINISGNLNGMNHLLKKYAIELSQTTAIDFPMGSMFWCRSQVLKPWLEQKLTYEDFEVSNSNKRDGSLAHAIERLFLFGCSINNYTWGRISPFNDILTPVKFNSTNIPSPSAHVIDKKQNGTECYNKYIFYLKNKLRHYPFIVKLWHQLRPQGNSANIPNMLKCTSSLVEHNIDWSSHKSEFVIVLPAVRQDVFSGGPNTILLFAIELAKKGIHIHCLSHQPPTCTNDVLRNHLHTLTDIDSEVVSRFRVSCMSKTVTVNPNDVFCATAWWTVPVVKSLTRELDNKKFFYFIQDFEPLFYPWNEEHAKAISTYEANFIPIINESLLADFFCKMGVGRFADKKFQQSLLVFEPSVDRTVFHPQAKTEVKRNLLFYARPSAPRNLYNFGVEALKQLAKEGILNAENWNVYCLGEKIPSIQLSPNWVAEPLPWLGFADYATHIRQASVGLSLMLSPHTSYMPLELAACGVPVVTTTYINKTKEKLEALSPDIISVSADVESIVEGLRSAIQRAESDEPHVDKLRLPKTWETAFQCITESTLAYFSSKI